MSRPLRFGCQFQALRSQKEFLDSARRIEALGFDVGTFPDHFGGWASMWPSITAAAAVTTTLRLGPLTANNDLWNPVVLARDAVSADVFSNGRLELGLGAGWRDADYQMTGLTKDSPGTRIARLAEAVEIIRGYFSEGAFDYHGSFYDVEVPADRLRPTQAEVPIFIGGGGRKIIGLVANTADIIGVHINLGGGQFTIGKGASDSDQGVVQAAVTERLSWIEQDRPTDRADAELQLFMLEVRSGDSSDQVAQTIAPTFGIAPEDVVSSPWFLTGPPEEMAQKLLEIRDRYGITYFTVREDHVDTMAEVFKHLDR